MNYKLIISVLLATSLMLQPLLQVAQAEEGTSTPDTVRVFFGGFFAQLDTDTKVTSSGLGGRKISLEDDLGLDDDDTVFFAGLRWRISKRHSVGITQLVLDRDGDQTVTRELAIGDKVFTINTMTETLFNYRTTHFDYRYSFYASDRLNVGVLLGISDIDFEFEVVGNVMGPGGGVITESVHEQEDYPVPSIGMGIRYVLNENWYLRAGATYLEYDDGEWEASLLIAGLGVEWYPWRNFGFGLGYDLVKIEYDEDKDPGKDEWDVDFGYQGIQLRVIGRF